MLQPQPPEPSLHQKHRHLRQMLLMPHFEDIVATEGVSTKAPVLGSVEAVAPKVKVPKAGPFVVCMFGWLTAAKVITGSAGTNSAAPAVVVITAEATATLFAKIPVAEVDMPAVNAPVVITFPAVAVPRETPPEAAAMVVPALVVPVSDMPNGGTAFDVGFGSAAVPPKENPPTGFDTVAVEALEMTVETSGPEAVLPGLKMGLKEKEEVVEVEVEGAAEDGSENFDPLLAGMDLEVAAAKVVFASSANPALTGGCGPDWPALRTPPFSWLRPVEVLTACGHTNAES